MDTPWAPRAVAGAVDALAGLAVAHLLARLVSTQDGPVEAVGTWIIRHTPGSVVEAGIQAVGTNDKPILIVGIVVAVTAIIAGLATLKAPIWPLLGMLAMAGIGAAAIIVQPGSAGIRLLPVLAGLITWLLLLNPLLEPLEHPDPTSRRSFITRVGLVAGLSAVATAVSPLVGSGRRRVEEARRALSIPGIDRPPVPAGADQGLAGQPPWNTPTRTFYRIDTALLPPAVDPTSWTLRIHGMVDRPIELTLDDLLARELTQDWITLNCVSNTVGGDLIGNAWWSGVRIAPLLAEAGVHADADGVLQTSHDGWTCLTPLTALTDDRHAMLAVAMNGEPLTIEHGFPVRMLVPGLYGYVSATKWLIDLKVTRFDQDEGYWTPLGWSAEGPVKLASRIDVPGAGNSVEADDTGRVTLAGVAWHQHTGIEAVQVSLDGGAWTDAELAVEPTIDSWVQWRISLPAGRGKHAARVRAVDAAGEVQTGASAAPAPDGASGWHKRTFEVS